MPTLLRMENISKRFPGVLANDRITFEVRRGEIHALLGENGAGKTTLMNILYGFYLPDSGCIWLEGRELSLNSPRNAIEAGIGMIHQHFMLVPALTVAENIVLGLRSPRRPFLDLRRAEREIARLSETYGLVVDPEAEVWMLPVGAQQRVEIIKALYRGADLLILDEPTAVLTPQEVGELFTILRRLAAEGHAVIFISHKLDEVMAISDRVTVLRDGRVVGTVNTAETDKATLARMMVGRDVLFRLEKEPVKPGETVLAVERLAALDDRGLPALQGVSFDIRRGEILGIAGVDGNGQRELGEVVTGLRPLAGGSIRVLGREITRPDPKALIRLGVGHIPEDRRHMGLLADFNVAENLIVQTFHHAPYSRWGFLRPEAITSNAERLMAAYDVRAPGSRVAVKTLSGGNQQKVMLARELSREPALLVAMQPTRGLDVGATEYVRRRLLDQRAQGVAILLVSTELEEILSLSDRIAVLFEGRVVGTCDAAEADVHELGMMMAGSCQ